ncbi:DUF4291 family protein [Kitasatospora sp. NPDC059648]|uniref:DUF4291 family protein n=1 Tax=Kitasatospora sp. NPDC059648 TaxID=3346894 RepID=UPI0036C0CB01
MLDGSVLDDSVLDAVLICSGYSPPRSWCARLRRNDVPVSLRHGLDRALERAVPSACTRRVHESQAEWKRELRRSPVRVQWDPALLPVGRPARRARPSPPGWGGDGLSHVSRGRRRCRAW